MKNYFIESKFLKMFVLTASVGLGSFMLAMEDDDSELQAALKTSKEAYEKEQEERGLQAALRASKEEYAGAKRSAYQPTGANPVQAKASHQPGTNRHI